MDDIDLRSHEELDPGRRTAARGSDRPGRSTGRLVAVAVLLVLAGVGGGYWYLTRDAVQPTAARIPPAPPVTVSTPVQKDIVEWDEYTGQFAAVEFVEIRARVSGYLQEVSFKDGQLVKKGDPLFVIDPRPYEIARATAQAQLVQTQARLDLANRQLSRAAELRQRENIPASTYDERFEEVRAATAAVDTAKAAIRSAELDLEFTHITAPVSGRISRHEVSVGNLVTGGDGGQTTLLTTIVSLDPIYFTFDMSEADYVTYQRAYAEGRLKSARDALLPVSARGITDTKWSYDGHLDFVDNQINRGAGTIRARGVFANPNFVITPGQFGRLRLAASERHPAMLIPDSAVVTDQARKAVMVVKDDGTVEPRVVHLGPIVDGLRVVRDGIEPTDRIIINGLLRARPGGKVTPQPGKIEPEAQTN